MLDIKKWIAKASIILDRYTHTGKTLHVSAGAIGKSYQAKYCNFFFPIPYIAEPYTVTMTNCSVVNVGTCTLANLYATAPTYIYVRVYNSGSGLTSGGTFQGQAMFDIVVGGGSM